MTTQPTTDSHMRKASAIADFVGDHGVDLSWQRALYEELHAHPELSQQEEWTAGRIAQELERFSCRVTTSIGGHGLVAAFTNGDGPTVLFRADFDGLPVLEETEAPFASTRTQERPDGSVVPTMHACGHDMHTTALMGMCAVLDARRDAWSGTFIALFQPAEEDASGAQSMVDDGLFDAIPLPDVYLGQHIVAGPAGYVMSRPGGVLAACDTITITLHGRSSHGSMPHRSIDPTFLAAMIVVRLQGIVGRETNPGDFAVITVGSLQAGNSNNTIPGTATLVLNCRFYDDAVKKRTYSAIERVVRAECAASGCTKDPEIVYSHHGELTDNDPTVFEAVRPAFDAVFGDDSSDGERWTASEDFSAIPRAQKLPYLYWLVGCTPREQWQAAVEDDRIDDIPVNHSGRFLPDYEPTVDACTKAALAGVLSYLAITSDD